MSNGNKLDVLDFEKMYEEIDGDVLKVVNTINKKQVKEDDDTPVVDPDDFLDPSTSKDAWEKAIKDKDILSRIKNYEMERPTEIVERIPVDTSKQNGGENFIEDMSGRVYKIIKPTETIKKQQEINENGLSEREEKIRKDCINLNGVDPFKEKVEKYLEYKKTDYINENKIPSFDQYNMNISKEEIDKINSWNDGGCSTGLNSD